MYALRYILIFLLLMLTAPASVIAQTDREFWFAAPDVFSNNANFNLPIVVRLTSFSVPASVTISIPADAAFIPIVISIPANSTQTVDLSPWVSQLQNGPPNTILNKGLLIRSDNDITAYYEVVSSYCNCNPEIFALKGKNALGNEFFISSQYTYNIDTIRHPPATTSFDVVATLDNTTVTIVPSQPIVGHAAGTSFSIVLNKGQTYSATGIWRDNIHHLQGSLVTSDKPIAVTLKDDLVFGDGPGADLIGDQTVPTSVIGNEYIVAKGFLVPRDRVYVLAVQDNTPIYLDGSSAASILLNKGQSWTFDLSNSSTYIRSDKKFYVYHVTGVNDELGSAIIPKLSCTGSNSVNIVRSSNNLFGVMLVTQTGNEGNFTVNGNPGVLSAGNFLPVPGTGGAYVAATIDLSGYLPAGSVLRFVNTTGKFSLGLIDGDGNSGSRYGFFSDFKSSNVSGGGIEICPHDSAQLNAFGGVSYEWSPAAGLNDPHIASPKASPANTTRYTVIITSTDGCIDSAFVNVVVKDPPVPDLSFSQQAGNPLQISFQASVSTGASYNWTINGGIYTGQTLSYTFPQTGNYPVKLKMTQTDGCTDSITRIIPVLIQSAEIIQPNDTSICKGRSVPLSTSAKPMLDFRWSPTDYLDDPASAKPTATPPVTTKYYFTANILGPNLVVNGDFSTGNTGFSSDYTYTGNGFPVGMYGVGPNPAAWLPNAPACNDHTSGTGNMMMVNGAEQPNIKVWSQTVTVKPNTSYAFSAWLENITTINPAILQFSINGQLLGTPLNANVNDCVWDQFYTVWNSGDATTAVISIVNMNTILSGNDFALDDISFSPLTLQRDSVTITVNDVPLVKAKPDTSICPGNPLPLQATGAFTYLWTPASTLSDATSATPVAIPNQSTEYIVTGTSRQGCTATDTVVVNVYTHPDNRLTSDTAICSGDNVQLHIEGGSSYSWSPAALLDNPFSPTPLATLSRETMFRVSFSDANGCPENDSVKISVRTPPVFTKPSDLSVCEGSSGVLGLNDYPYYVYSWQPATGLSDPTAPRPVISPAASGQYTVNISDSTCPQYNSTFQVNVTVKSNPIVTATKLHDIDCSQATTQLDASGAPNYVWWPAAGLSDTRSSNPIVSIDTTTTYFVKGTALNGCYAFSQVTVNVRAEGKNLFVVPNAFSPNGDGHNDCYSIQRWGDVQLEDFSIFNRKGLRVFTTRNPSECWDGKFNGHPQPAGGYVYVISAKTFCGPVTRTGILMLVR